MREAGRAAAWQVVLTYDLSTPAGMDSFTDVLAQLLSLSLSKSLRKTIPGHFYRTGRYHSMTEPCCTRELPPTHPFLPPVFALGRE